MNKIIILLIFVFSLNAENIKCITSNNFTSNKIKQFDKIQSKVLDKPILQTFKISKSGYFKIYFDTTNINGNLPSLVNENGIRIPNTYLIYVDSLINIFEEVLNIECNKYLFPLPKKNNYYEIFIVNLPDGIFGYTDKDESFEIPGNLNINKYPTFIVVDNDFSLGYRTLGLNALRATAAHEFFHAIQISNYGIWETEFFFYEIFAEGFEHFVFPNVTDFIFDLKTYFHNIDNISLYENTVYPGYERAIWSIYLKNRFGIDFIRDVWIRIENELPSLSISNIIKNRNSSFENEFSNFSYQNLESSINRNNPFYSFTNLMPNLNFSGNLNYFTKYNVLNSTFIPTSSQYYSVKYPNESTFYFIITNLLNSKSTTQNIVSIAVNDREVKLSNVNLNNWNISVFNSNLENIKNNINAFPNPFKPSLTSLKIPVDNNLNYQFIESKLYYQLEIYNNQFINIYKNNISPIQLSKRNYLIWDGKDFNGNNISSGVYYFIAKSELNNYEGKFTVIK